MFLLIKPTHQKQLHNLVQKISKVPKSIIVEDLASLIDQIREDIPEKKRISTGRYTIIKKLGQETYPRLEEVGVNLFEFAAGIYKEPEVDPFVRSFAVQLIAIYGLEIGKLNKTLAIFEEAASDDHWIVRECSSGLIRKLVKAFPTELSKWYLGLVKSKDPLQRRFVSESLRPVVENRWIHKDPDYALSIIKYLYKESEPYPRTSIGNNLSDWMRVDPERAWRIVEELATNGNKNSYWIAYRACRNLVKTKPVQVMELLGLDHYKYKTRIYHLKDYQ